MHTKTRLPGLTFAATFAASTICNICSPVKLSPLLARCLIISARVISSRALERLGALFCLGALCLGNN